jgi:hypothetical protein
MQKYTRTSLFPANVFFLTCTIVFFAALPFVGCSGAAAGNTTAGKTVTDNTAAGNTADGNASFSAKIDGVDFSANKGSDNLNAAFRLKEGEKHLFFMLTDIDNPIQKLNFEIPAKVGATTITILPKYSYTGYVNKDFAPYDDDGVTITINSLTSTRVSGTFSGTYKAEAGWPKAKPTVQVTDGKFDIPFSTSAQWKKMYQAE